MARRLIIERLDEGSSLPGEDSKLDPPTLTSIKLVFGVGRRPNQAPTVADFSPVYTVQIPVFSLTGLDSDGVYEFDAVRTLDDLQSRAQRRTWAMRLELGLTQDAKSVHLADVYVQTPFADDGPSLEVAGAGQRGTTTMGGARELVLATSLAHDGAAVAALGGEFTVQLADADPASADAKGSALRTIALRLTNYEFQG